jgi:carbamoyltransferase
MNFLDAERGDAVNILGISAFYHDSAACLVRNGSIAAAAQEERFTRKKHDHSFPMHAVSYCLKEGGIEAKELDYVAFYDKPFLKFERILDTYLSYAPVGIHSFIKAMPVWIKEKLWMKQLIKDKLGYEGIIIFPEHHESHAASAFFPSPFTDSAFLTIDGVGEWATTSFGVGSANQVKILSEIHFPHSLGLLYSAFTYYTGFKVNSGEYKVMGLAPYGQPKYKDVILSRLLDLKEDGSLRLNMEYFNFCSGLTMTNDKFHELLGGPPRKSESPLTQREMDLARSIQDVTEEAMMRMARHVFKQTGQRNLCLAGGVALNCVSNGRILREGPFENIWIQPAAGDAGGALGAALFVWYQYLGNVRQVDEKCDSQSGSYLGPRFSNAQVREYLDRAGAIYHHVGDEDKLLEMVAEALAEGKVVGWHQGRMEFGPRALGARSIIGDARNRTMQSVMNLKIKFRESFRPFAPSVLRERLNDYFEMDSDTPYMLLVAPVKESIRIPMSEEEKTLFGIDKLNIPRSIIPAVTHVDYSGRIQSVHAHTNPRYHKLICQFEKLTGCGTIVNTSFNVRGEPIVCAPEDSYRCFMRTEMDMLVIEDYVLHKKEQPRYDDKENWMEKFELD